MPSRFETICQKAFKRLDTVSASLYTLNVPKKLIAIRVKESHLAQLEQIAKHQDDSVSEVIRRAIEDFLKKKKG